MKYMKRYIQNAYVTFLGIFIVTVLGCGNNPIVPLLTGPPSGNDRTGFTRQVTFKITETTIVTRNNHGEIETSNFDSKTFVEVNARLVLTIDGTDQDHGQLNYGLEPDATAPDPAQAAYTFKDIPIESAVVFRVEGLERDTFVKNTYPDDISDNLKQIDLPTNALVQPDRVFYRVFYLYKNMQGKRSPVLKVEYIIFS